MRKTVYASEVAKLDSNVYTGGGTDDTKALQEVLDLAVTDGGIKLVMDGAALVTGLKLYSNTTIECMDKDCGFYLADNSNCAIIINANPTFGDFIDRNITLIGGTYNHNCMNQAHDVPETNKTFLASKSCETLDKNKLVIAVEFYGVEYVNVRDVTVRDQRTFAFTIGNFKHVNIENTYIELENEILFGNQDGFHFWGPGQFLTMRNIGGKTEDDFMNIGPDEKDGVSDITDVLIDGVMLDSAWQGIRLLSRDKGKLDRVTIKNVTGTYHCYGFYINPWFAEETNGNFGNIVFENIDLRPLNNVLEGICENNPFLFCIGGEFESLTFKNIMWHNPYDNRSIFLIGYPYHKYTIPFITTPHIGSLTIDGMQITDKTGASDEATYMLLRGRIDRMNIRDLDIYRDDDKKDKGCFVKTLDSADIGRLSMDRVWAESIKTLADLSEGKVEAIRITDAVVKNVENPVLENGKTAYKKIEIEKE